MTYASHLFVTFSIYALMGQSLVLAAGLGGMMSLAQAASLGVAAYSAGIIATMVAGNIYLQIFASTVLCLLFGWILSLSGARHLGDSFILASLAIQVLFQAIVTNWQSLTGGPLGLSGIPPARIFGINISRAEDYAAAFCIWLLVSWASLWWLKKSHYSAALCAASSDPILARSLGIGVRGIKSSALVICSLLMVIPGLLYASYTRFLEPTAFSVSESILVLTVLIIGGQRSLGGVAAASAGLVLSIEALKAVGLPTAVAANGRQVVFGILLVLAVLFPRSSSKKSAL